MTKNPPPINPNLDTDADTTPPPPPLPIRLITHNVRYYTKTPTHNESPWPIRRPLLCSQLHFTAINQPNTFICLQEVLHSQLIDILSTLNSLSSNSPSPSTTTPSTTPSPVWTHIGVARDDGHTKGEYSPIIYQPSTYRLLSSHTRWLSPTPLIPSRGWDAACTRIVTIGHFLHRETQRRLLVLCTHFDHVSVRAREESARLILEIIRQETRGNDAGEAAVGKADADGNGKVDAVFLAGDFNSPPNDGAYKIMTAQIQGWLIYLLKCQRRGSVAVS